MSRKLKCENGHHFLLEMQDEDRCPECGSTSVESDNTDFVGKIKEWVSQNKMVVTAIFLGFLIIIVLLNMNKCSSKKVYKLTAVPIQNQCQVEIKVLNEDGEEVIDKNFRFKDGINSTFQSIKIWPYPPNGADMVIYAEYKGDKTVIFTNNGLQIQGKSCESGVSVNPCDDCNKIQVIRVINTTKNGKPALQIIALPHGCNIQYSIDNGKTSSIDSTIQIGSLVNCFICVKSESCPAWVPFPLNPVTGFTPLPSGATLSAVDLTIKLNELILNPTRANQDTVFKYYGKTTTVFIEGIAKPTDLHGYCQKLRNPGMVKSVVVVKYDKSSIHIKEVLFHPNQS